MAIAIVDAFNSPGFPGYSEEDFSRYLQIRVWQAYYDLEATPLYTEFEVDLYKCSLEDLRLDGSE